MRANAKRAWWRRRRTWLAVYLLLLLAHHGLRLRPAPLPPLRSDEARVALSLPGADDAIEVAYRDRGPRGAPVLLMLHGSPGGLRDFDAVGDGLEQSYRVIAIDLPGFGKSTLGLPDYSFRTHAMYVGQLLQHLQLDRVHVVAFSMGGGVGLELYDQDPQRVASLVMVAAIGVQELELLGNYELNHLVHGVQWAGLWALHNLVPHMGRLDDLPLNVPYARNFYDSDQRPLRGVLREFEPPLLIVHGPADPLVPYAAAQEHARLVPQSELVSLEASHFMVWTRPGEVARTLDEFVQRVVGGDAPRRADASEERVRLARLDWSTQASPRAHGIALFVLVLLLVFGTFLSEDLTSIAAGLLIAQGRLSWGVGLGAVFCGIYFGDLLLYAVGRGLGRAVLHRRPWRWWVHASDLDQAQRWFERRGFVAILLTRFLPGTRLPAYVAAGVVRAQFARFALYFLIAVALWTPLLVGFSAWLGQEAMERLDEVRRNSLGFFAITALGILLLVRLLFPLLTLRGRRLAVGRWRRVRAWEFWPTWIVYLPVVLFLFFRCRRYGGLRTLSAVNPGMPLSGIVGESKSDILSALEDSERVARSCLLPASASVDERWRRVAGLQARTGIEWPLVLKPETGERGQGVNIARNGEQARRILEVSHCDLIAQEFVDGPEFGVFYLRMPGDSSGQIFSITEKHRPVLVGDGEHDLEHLILHDERAVCMASLHLRVHARRLDRVLAPGEEFELVEVGAHARGAVFLDGHRWKTPELERAIDELSQRFSGFYFGRYDLRAVSGQALKEGRDFKVLELNGLTSEASHIYAPGTPWREGQRVLRQQWEWALRIGEANRRAGHATVSLWKVLEQWGEHRRHRRANPAPPHDLQVESA